MSITLVTLPAKQAAALRQIAILTSKLGQPPTRRELAVALDIGEDTNPHYLVGQLRTKGLLAPARRRHRDFVLTETGRRWLEADAKQFSKAASVLRVEQ